MRRFRTLLIALTAAASASAWAASHHFAHPAGAAPAKSLAAAKHDKLLTAKRAYEMLPALENQRGGPTVRFELEDRYTWSRRWMDAERDSAASGADRRRAAEAHLGRMRRLLGVGERFQQAGIVSPADVAALRYFAAEAELWVIQANPENFAT